MYSVTPTEETSPKPKGSCYACHATDWEKRNLGWQKRTLRDGVCRVYVRVLRCRNCGYERELWKTTSSYGRRP